MSVAEELYISPEEYLERERQAETRSEYFNGRIYAMAGASPDHEAICANTVIALGLALKGRGCRPYGSNLRVCIPETGMYTYPDVSVICGAPELDGGHHDVVRNPKLIVEITSPFTESCDRGDKFAHYRTIESLTDYLLVAQDRPWVEHYARSGETWVLTTGVGLNAVLNLPSLGCELTLADVYDGLEFPSGPLMRHP